MKIGDEIKCIHCGKQSFLIKKSLMDGWKKTGEILACSACGNVIKDLTEDVVNEVDGNTKTKSLDDGKLDKLAQFLNTEKVKKKIIEADEKTFCRDCKNYVKHPFFNICGITKNEVNPMDDCPLYEITLEEEK